MHLTLHFRLVASPPTHSAPIACTVKPNMSGNVLKTERAVVNVHECVSVHVSPSAPSLSVSKFPSSSIGFRCGNSQCPMPPRRSWQDVLHLIHHHHSRRHGPVHCSAINTASCASIINAAKKKKPKPLLARTSQMHHLP